MKKTIITLAIVFGISLCSFAQGGLFQYGDVSDMEYYGSNRQLTNPLMPAGHNYDGDVNGQTGTEVPVGTGLVLLMGLGGGYLLMKRHRE